MRHRSIVSILAWLGIGAGVVGLSYGQRGGSSSNPIPSGQVATTVVVTSSPAGAACSDNNVYIYSVNGASFCCTNGTRQACGATAALGLPADPSACPSSQWATDQNTSGTLTCSQPNFTDLAGTATDAQIPNTITVNVTEARAISINSPTNAEDVTVWRTPVAITVTRLDCVVTSGSATYTLRYGTDRSAAGSQIVGGGTACSSVTTGNSNTGLSVAISAGSYVWLETTAASTPAPANMGVVMTYTIP